MSELTYKEIPESKCASYGNGLTEAEEATIASIITRLLDEGGHAVFIARAKEPLDPVLREVLRGLFSPEDYEAQGVPVRVCPPAHRCGVIPDAPPSPFMAEFVEIYVSDLAKCVGFDHMIVGIEKWLRSLDMLDVPGGGPGSRMADALKAESAKLDYKWRYWVDKNHGYPGATSERKKDAYGISLASQGCEEEQPEDSEDEHPDDLNPDDY